MRNKKILQATPQTQYTHAINTLQTVNGRCGGTHTSTHTCRQRNSCRRDNRVSVVAVRGGGQYERSTHSHVICTVTGLVGVGCSRKLIGLSGANGIAGWGLRVTWASGEAQRRKQSITHIHTLLSTS